MNTIAEKLAAVGILCITIALFFRPGKYTDEH